MEAHKYRFPTVLLCIVLFALVLVCSCNRTTKPEKADPKADLAKSLKGANVTGFDFSTREDDATAITSFTNSAVRTLITLDKDANGVVLQYASVTDKKANTTRTYKTEVLRSGTALALQVSDLATNQVVSKDNFPTATPHDEPKFNTLEECLKDFDCKHRGELQCEANRTCKDQFAAVICCLTNGQCFSVHFIIRPTSLRCRFNDLIPNLEGLVLRQ
jgi:hypothetical protein